MQEIIKSGFKYVMVAGFFGICINLIYLAVPVYVMTVYDRVLFSFSQATLYTLSLGLLFSLTIMALIDYLRQKILAQAGNRLVEKTLPFVIRSMPGYGRGLQDLETLRNAIVRGHIFHIMDLPWVLIYLGILYLIHPLVGMVSLAGVFLVVGVQMLLRVIEKKRYVIADVAFENNTDSIKTALARSELASSMGMMSAITEKHREKNTRVLSLQNEADSFQSGTGSALRMIHVLTFAAVFGAGATLFFKDQITAGVIFASVIIIIRLFYPLERSLSDMKASIEAMAAYARLKQFVNTGAQKEMLSLPQPEGKLDVEAISLSLNNRAVLYNVSFSLNPGESLGVIGPSSAGKTSLCKILLGIWPALAGKVRLDGAEVAQWPRDEFGKYVGYLPQESELFAVSVAENISRLRDVDSEKVVHAAQKAGAHEMILKLPQGYDTRIDGTGKNLSAGQRQLICLARALYDDPKLVILDEPHTHLDDLGLRLLLTALNNLKQEKTTTVVVTDRPNLLLNMDKILVIKEGQVAMYGPGKDVLNQLAGRQQPQQAAGV